MKLVIAEPIGLSQKMIANYERILHGFDHRLVIYYTIPASAEDCMERCAAIDIIELESILPVNHPQLNAKNCMVMPHMAYATAEAIEKRSVIVLKNIVSWLIGKGGNVIA